MTALAPSNSPAMTVPVAAWTSLQVAPVMG
jgi:hypothetical protein